MNYTITSDIWAQMIKVYEGHKDNDYKSICSTSIYRKAIACYVAVCILSGLSETEMLEGHKYPQLFHRLHELSPSSGETQKADLSDTYKDKLQRIIPSNFYYMTEPLKQNWNKMKYGEILVDLSIFDALDDD